MTWRRDDPTHDTRSGEGVRFFAYRRPDWPRVDWMLTTDPERAAQLAQHDYLEVVELAPAPPSPEQTERCPTCESDDPRFVNAPHPEKGDVRRYVWTDASLLTDAGRKHWHCPDPFHAPQPQEQEPRFTTTVHDRFGNPVSGCDGDALAELKRLSRALREIAADIYAHYSAVDPVPYPALEIAVKLDALNPVPPQPPEES